jgi:ubiquinone/menaquinone biosynthesis C-methylase UbiE
MHKINKSDSLNRKGTRAQYKDSKNLESRINIHNRYSVNKLGWAKWVFGQYQFPLNSRILELGCGNANIWFENRDRIPDSISITLSDFSEGMVESARKMVENTKKQFNFMVIDAQEISYEDSTFDVVIANGMLYHVPDIAKAVSEISRVLKPGGKFYCTTAGSSHLKEIDEYLLKIDKRILFTDQTLKRFMLDNGINYLKKHFSDINISRYEDALRVTDTNELIDYILSSAGISNVNNYLTGRNLEELKKLFEEEKMKKGYIFISKESGIFIARNKKE